MTAVSLVWRVTGISWRSLDVLFGGVRCRDRRVGVRRPEICVRPDGLAGGHVLLGSFAVASAEHSAPEGLLEGALLHVPAGRDGGGVCRAAAAPASPARDRIRCRAGCGVRHENRRRAELPAVLHRPVRGTAGWSVHRAQAEVDVRGGRDRPFRRRLVSRSSDLHTKHQLVAHRASRPDVAIRREPGHRFPSPGLQFSVRAQRRLHRHRRPITRGGSPPGQPALLDAVACVRSGVPGVLRAAGEDVPRRPDDADGRFSGARPELSVRAAGRPRAGRRLEPDAALAVGGPRPR